MLKRVLIANRGEIAVRIARAAHGLGMQTVAVYPPLDATSLHTQTATEAIELPSSNGAGGVLGGYLDADNLVETAVAANCDCIHPGYGFLAENTEFAEKCVAAGLAFVGPSPNVLRLFGDKVQARAHVASLNIPVLAGSCGAVSSYEQLENETQDVRYPIMLKAAAGGGGRGMRAVHSESELRSAYERCSGEAEQAFGDGTLFFEALLKAPRHIEVQILGDMQGSCIHLFERECSIQLRNQKVIEVAPAPNLDPALRQRLLDDAVHIAQSVDYTNAITIEFLIDPDSGDHYFIECNARIQVEHTVTEETSGVDLVQAQFRVASGESLEAMDLASQDDIDLLGRTSIQARVVATGAGQVTAYKEPSGPGVRVDGYGYDGFEVKSHFDPLLAKVIGTSNSGYSAALNRTLAAVDEFHIDGITTNLTALSRILQHDDVRNGHARTTFLADNENLLSLDGTGLTKVQSFLAEREPNGTKFASTSSDSAATPHRIIHPEVGEAVVRCPMDCTVVSCTMSVGSHVHSGQTIAVVSAMKMETQLTAASDGILVDVLPLQAGDRLAANQVLATISPHATDSESDQQSTDRTSAPSDETWGELLDRVDELRGLALQRLAPGSEDPGVVRQRDRGKLTCRERIGLILDEDSFHEVGSVTGFASYDEFGEISAFTPANHVGGWGDIERRTVVVCADDFTSRGGHADGAIGAKSSYLDRLSLEMRAPSIRLLDGSSGGGSVAAMVPKQKAEGESKAKESTGAIRAGRPRVSGGGGSYLPGHLGSTMYAQQLCSVPVVNMLLGSVVGIGAAKAVLGHFSVMVRDIAQLFVAGPPVVKHAMGYDISKEELGDWRIHCTNGSVDNLAESEQEAALMVRQFLSYLPSSVFETPPIVGPNPSDPPDRREDELYTIVPRKRTTTFDIRRTIALIADQDSFFEIGSLWGTDQVTGFVRFNGHPVGVIASDSRHVNGGALTADGCDKLIRHLDLCDLFHVPILNLVDNPGFAVGIEHETTGTIRRGGEWMVAFAQATVPIFTVLMRRSFGVAGNNYATPRAQPSMRVTWPAADVGGIPPEGGIEAAYKRQLAEAKDPEALRAELNARIESARGPLGPLSRFQIEEMIDPRDTRRYICEWVEMAYRIVAQPDRLGSRAIQFRP